MMSFIGYANHAHQLFAALQVIIMAADAKTLKPELESKGYSVSVFQTGEID